MFYARSLLRIRRWHGRRPCAWPRQLQRQSPGPSLSEDPNARRLWTSAGPVRARLKRLRNDLRQVGLAIKTFLAHLEQSRVEEARRVESGAGARDDGKRMSQRPDLKAQNKMRAEGSFYRSEPVLGTIPGIPVGTQFSSRWVAGRGFGGESWGVRGGRRRAREL